MRGGDVNNARGNKVLTGLAVEVCNAEDIGCAALRDTVEATRAYWPLFRLRVRDWHT